MRYAFFIIIIGLLTICPIVCAEDATSPTRTLDGTFSTTEILRMIVRSDRPINPEDTSLWAHLENTEEWGYPEELLLKIMVHGALGKKKMHLIERAEKLAASGKFGRKSVVGGALAEVGILDRAIPLLEEALRENMNTEYRSGVALTLYRACLAAGKWQKAEAVFGDVKPALDASGIREQMGIIAIVAARSGAHEDALRIWRERAALDAGDLRGLEDLAKAGLREHLRKYYQDIKSKEPQNKIADKALGILEDETQRQ